MKKILVTDGKGFLGSNFIELFKKKYKIVSPKEDEADFADLSSTVKYLKEQAPDAVIFANGFCDPLYECAFDSNALIEFKNVQYAAALAGVKKIIVLSSAADTDASAPYENATEEDIDAFEPASGAALEKRFIHTLAAKDRMSTVLRFFGLFGKGSDIYSNRQTEILSHAISGKKQIALDGDKVFSNLYIEDACKIISLFLDNDYPKGIYNVASPTPCTLSELAKKAKAFAKKNGRDIDVFIGENQEFELTANTDKLAAAIGNLKFTAHATAIAKTLEWFAAHKSKLKGERK